jgi:hypothetical protein
MAIYIWSLPNRPLRSGDGRADFPHQPRRLLSTQARWSAVRCKSRLNHSVGGFQAGGEMLGESLEKGLLRRVPFRGRSMRLKRSSDNLQAVRPL